LLRRADVAFIGLALVAHAGLGLWVARANKPPRPRSRPIVLEYARKPEPPPAVPEPAAPKPAEPPSHLPARKLAFRPRAAHVAPTAEPPRARSSAPAPTAAPAAPAYAVAMTSTTAVAAMEVPSGSSGGFGPAGRAGRPGGVPGGTGDGFHPASARDVGSMPDVDVDACGRAAIYPRDAEQSGTEGDVRLRVGLDEHGKVHNVRVLSGPGHGLDAAAIEAIRHRCRFTPAIGRDGQPVAFVIESYTFHFQLPR
jgi:protein TonB